MPTFYFHVRRGSVIYLDHQGLDLADLKSAWDHALGDAALLLRKDDSDDASGERWIEIDDEFGKIVSTPPQGTVFQ